MPRVRKNAKVRARDHKTRKRRIEQTLSQVRDFIVQDDEKRTTETVSRSGLLPLSQSEMSASPLSGR